MPDIRFMDEQDINTQTWLDSIGEDAEGENMEINQHEGERFCVHCNEWFPEDEGSEIDGEWFCDSCRDDNYFFCESCDEYRDLDDMRVVHTGHGNIYVCENCIDESSDYYYCSECEEVFVDGARTEHHTVYINSYTNNYVCPDCYERRGNDGDIYECEECGDSWYEGSLHWVENSYGNSECYCPDCYDNRKPRKFHRFHMQNYSYKPTPKFFGKYVGKEKLEDEYTYIARELDDFPLGVELEIDGGTDKDDCVNDLVSVHAEDNHVYCKSDGSLTNSGIEIVTYPATLEYHMSSFGWDKIIEVARSYDYTSHDNRNCGLHVHVGKSHLGETDEQKERTIAKIILFTERFFKELFKFSRRRQNQMHWCYRNDFDYCERDNEMRMYEKIEKYIERNSTNLSDRYHVLNLTNENTIEFRIFNGSLINDTIMATLQLVHNVCEAAVSKSFYWFMHCSWADIAKFRKYPELDAYLTKLSLNGEKLLNDKNIEEDCIVRIIPDMDRDDESNSSAYEGKTGYVSYVYEYDGVAKVVFDDSFYGTRNFNFEMLEVIGHREMPEVVVEEDD